MNTRRFKLIVVISCLTALITACGGQSATTSPAKPTARPIIASTQVPTASAVTVAAPTQAAPTLTTTEVSGSGTITGYIQLQAPPTPPMAVYAVDPTAKVWVMVEVPGADSVAPFSITVPSGTYQVFAYFADPAIKAYAGYAAENGPSLGTITVAANQTVSDIVLHMPSPGDCGSSFGVPTSPDGRYSAAPGPDANCMATQVAGYVYEPLPLAECQNLQDIASQTLKFQFALNPQGGFSDYKGQSGYGCTLTAVGTAADFTDPGTVTADLVKAFSGWTEDPMGAANGPTGAATTLTRDKSMMHVRANWWPKMGITCPSDQPISACPLTPEQKQYTVVVEAAQKK